jgi:hypothetical protein
MAATHVEHAFSMTAAIQGNKLSCQNMWLWMAGSSPAME